MMLLDLDKVIGANSEVSFIELPAQHEVRGLLRQISIFITQTCLREELLLLLGQKFVQLLYRINIVLSRECYTLLLERVFEMSKRVAKEVSTWILYSDDEVNNPFALFKLLIFFRLFSGSLKFLL
jgi:CCR4-NOT transcription complex subunit 1